MLSPHEFTVGTFGNAVPLSLILPRNAREESVLIGQVDGAAAAVFLSGRFAFQFFLSEGNDHWRGLIIPEVRIEVDETSVFDPDYDGGPMGSVIRTGPQLIVRARSEGSFGRTKPIILHDGLAPTNDLRAAFTKWQVVIGNGPEKRVLLAMNAAQTQIAQQ